VELSRKRLATYGLFGAAALVFLATLTAAAVYLSAAFVVHYAKLPAQAASGGQHAATRPAAR